MRIGKPFTFKEDIYSLLFIANVRREYKDQCVQEALERVRCLDLMIKDYRLKNPELFENSICKDVEAFLNDLLINEHFRDVFVHKGIQASPFLVRKP